MGDGTIVALSSGALPAGVAVLRISGPSTEVVLRALTHARPTVPRQATLRAIYGPDAELLDRGLVIWFPGPESFTGEDVAELHVHGGPAVVSAVLQAVTDSGQVRLAEAGEFTRRAFDNGRLDLTAVEGLADLIAARTESQRRSALRQSEGGLYQLVEGWRTRLIQAMGHVEAMIDFSDEEIPAGLQVDARDRLTAIQAEIEAALADGRRGELNRTGVRVALVGPPNVGKSSLLNRLTRRDAAIVSEVAGTTRDVIEVTLDLAGYPVIVADTAGLRVTDDAVEAVGVARAEAWRRQADVPIYVVDARELTMGDAGAIDGRSTMILANKIDLRSGPLPTELRGVPVFPVSAVTGAGIDLWVSELAKHVCDLAAIVGDAGIVTRRRHQVELGYATGALRRALVAPSIELMAEDVRVAVSAIGRLTGAVDVEDLLDVIFGEFCIGK